MCALIDRDAGKKSLESVLNIPKNVQILEKQIAAISHDHATYEDICMSVVCQIKSGMKLNLILSNLKANVVGLDTAVFSEVRDSIEEQQSFIENPFEVDEGVLECKCGSRRTISFSKQIRCGDEGTTVFAKCVDCGKTWNT